jgi:hypothetical protein
MLAKIQSLLENSLSCTLVLMVVLTGPVAAQSRDDPDRNPFPVAPLVTAPVALEGLTAVSDAQWDPVAVRRVLQNFAFGGHASDTQIQMWADMRPQLAISQMLNFDWVNARLSQPDLGDGTAALCHSLTELQTLWGSEDAGNPVSSADRGYYSLLGPNTTLSPSGLYFTWSRAMYTRGCNQFLHKMAFYLTNYHASIHIQNAGTGLIRDYYNDTLTALNAGEDFVGLMFNAARNGALAFAYGHAANFVHPQTGAFSGNDDFAREYFQLLFGIEGTTEDSEYHEGVSIENNARLLTGMAPDLVQDRFDSVSRLDWLYTDIDFTDHVDSTGRRIFNRSVHFDFRLGAASCLEILHRSVCGATAEDKLRALGPIAASHQESKASIPLKLVRFFADTVITPVEAESLQTAWHDADFDLLRFIRVYAISTQFHDPSTWKYWSAFERNLIVHNATVLDNEESFAKPFFTDPLIRMSQQGAIPFAPVRDVFGGQTGNDAANDRFLFKIAWSGNVEFTEALAQVSTFPQRDDTDLVPQWNKDWSSIIPPDSRGEFRVHHVADWLWNRFIADGGAQFDVLARAQVYSLLATGFDFGLVIESNGQSTDFTSLGLEPGTIANAYLEVLGDSPIDFSDIRQQHNVGMAINFISMLPYAFATGGRVP